jgi:threonine/homoserine/homoserine lactone efflux protein
MKNRNKVIYIVISAIAISFPIAFLLGIISAKITFPIIFTLMGCLQLFHGLFIESKDKKHLRILSIIFGILFILFGIFIVFPNYYF